MQLLCEEISPAWDIVLVHSVRVANATQREPYPRKLCYVKVTATTTTATAVTSEAEHFVVVADLAGIYVAGHEERKCV